MAIDAAGKHRKGMTQAIRAAKNGIRAGQTPFGACIVRRGRVIATAHNVVWKTTDITAHAEIHALRQACRKLKTIDLSGSVIYSTCEPCPMCFSACHWARISGIVYGTSIEDARRAGFNEFCVSNLALKKLGQTRVIIRSGYMKRQAQELFTQWLERKDSRAY